MGSSRQVQTSPRTPLQLQHRVLELHVKAIQQRMQRSGTPAEVVAAPHSAPSRAHAASLGMEAHNSQQNAVAAAEPMCMSDHEEGDAEAQQIPSSQPHMDSSPGAASWGSGHPHGMGTHAHAHASPAPDRDHEHQAEQQRQQRGSASAGASARISPQPVASTASGSVRKRRLRDAAEEVVLETAYDAFQGLLLPPPHASLAGGGTAAARVGACGGVAALSNGRAGEQATLGRGAVAAAGAPHAGLATAAPAVSAMPRPSNGWRLNDEDAAHAPFQPHPPGHLRRCTVDPTGAVSGWDGRSSSSVGRASTCQGPEGTSGSAGCTVGRSGPGSGSSGSGDAVQGSNDVVLGSSPLGRTEAHASAHVRLVASGACKGSSDMLSEEVRGAAEWPAAADAQEDVPDSVAAGSGPGQLSGAEAGRAANALGEPPTEAAEFGGEAVAVVVSGTPLGVVAAAAEVMVGAAAAAVVEGTPAEGAGGLGGMGMGAGLRGVGVVAAGVVVAGTPAEGEGGGVGQGTGGMEAAGVLVAETPLGAGHSDVGGTEGGASSPELAPGAGVMEAATLPTGASRAADDGAGAGPGPIAETPAGPAEGGAVGGDAGARVAFEGTLVAETPTEGVGAAEGGEGGATARAVVAGTPVREEAAGGAAGGDGEAEVAAARAVVVVAGTPLESPGAAALAPTAGTSGCGWPEGVESRPADGVLAGSRRGGCGEAAGEEQEVPGSAVRGTCGGGRLGEGSGAEGALPGAVPPALGGGGGEAAAAPADARAEAEVEMVPATPSTPMPSGPRSGLGAAAPWTHPGAAPHQQRPASPPPHATTATAQPAELLPRSPPDVAADATAAAAVAVAPVDAAGASAALQAKLYAAPLLSHHPIELQLPGAVEAVFACPSPEPNPTHSSRSAASPTVGLLCYLHSNATGEPQPGVTTLPTSGVVASGTHRLLLLSPPSPSVLPARPPTLLGDLSLTLEPEVQHLASLPPDRGGMRLGDTLSVHDAWRGSGGACGQQGQGRAASGAEAGSSGSGRCSVVVLARGAWQVDGASCRRPARGARDGAEGGVTGGTSVSPWWGPSPWGAGRTRAEDPPPGGGGGGSGGGGVGQGQPLASAAAAGLPARQGRSIFRGRQQRRRGVDVVALCHASGAWSAVRHLPAPALTALCVLVVECRGGGGGACAVPRAQAGGSPSVWGQERGAAVVVVAAGQGGVVHAWAWRSGAPAEGEVAGQVGAGWLLATREPSESFSLPTAAYKGLAVNEVVELRAVGVASPSGRGGMGAEGSGGKGAGMPLVVGASSTGTVVVWDLARRQLLAAVHLPMFRISGIAPLSGLGEAARAAAAAAAAPQGRGQQPEEEGLWPLLLLARVQELGAGEAREGFEGEAGGGRQAEGHVGVMALWPDRADVRPGPDLSLAASVCALGGAREGAVYGQGHAADEAAAAVGWDSRDASACVATCGRLAVIGTEQVMVWDLLSGGLAAALDCSPLASALGTAVGSVAMVPCAAGGRSELGEGQGAQSVTVVAGVGDTCVLWTLRMSGGLIGG